MEGGVGAADVGRVVDGDVVELEPGVGGEAAVAGADADEQIGEDAAAAQKAPEGEGALEAGGAQGDEGGGPAEGERPGPPEGRGDPPRDPGRRLPPARARAARRGPGARGAFR